MTVQIPVPWTEILALHFSEVTDEYGPHTQAVASAFMALTKTQWLQRVGQPMTDSAIVVVHSWDDALTIFESDQTRYNANGVLEAPCKRVDPIFEQIPERETWWQKAREAVKPYIALHWGIPETISEQHQELMFENLYEFVSMLLAEIIATPEAECTYFRDQLTWFTMATFRAGGKATGQTAGCACSERNYSVACNIDPDCTASPGPSRDVDRVHVLVGRSLRTHLPLSWSTRKTVKNEIGIFGLDASGLGSHC